MSEVKIVDHALKLPLGGGGCLSGTLLLLALVVLLHRPREIDPPYQRLPLLLVPYFAVSQSTRSERFSLSKKPRREGRIVRWKSFEAVLFDDVEALDWELVQRDFQFSVHYSIVSGQIRACSAFQIGVHSSAAFLS